MTFTDNDKLLNHKKVNPTFKRKLTAVLADIRKDGTGLPICLVEVYRSPARQLALFLKGITKMKYPRYHGSGRACDFAFVVDGNLTWNVPHGWWQKVGVCAEQHELSWSARWKTNTELGHLEWKGK